MTHQPDLQTLVRAVEPGPAEAEREAIWAAIIARIGESEQARAPRAARGRFAPRRPLVIALTAAAIALLIIALLPAGEDGRAPLPANASAAEVFRAAADGAADDGLPVIGEGQYLYARVETAPSASDDEPSGSTMVAESWTASDGSGLRIISTRRGDETREIARVFYEPGSDVGHWIEGGTEVTEEPGRGDWRSVVSGARVHELPASADALLRRLRAGIDAGEVASLAERDLLVTDSALDLLIEAPLAPEQRAAALRMLADMPAWFTPGTTTRPVRVENRGVTEDSLGRSGIAVRIMIDLTPGSREHAPGSHETHYTADVILDPDDGRLLEVREHELGHVRTVAEQEVVDSLTGRASGLDPGKLCEANPRKLECGSTGAQPNTGGRRR
jgi:hypothetical protein